MNPYAVLGVSTHASDQEIKNAYRRLVKRYHPDRQSPEASHDQIAAINHAYDILSDSEKRARYDRGFAEIFFEQPPEEDPVEVYKREFKRKRLEKERLEREEKLAFMTAVYRFIRWLHFPVLLFAISLILHNLFTLQTIAPITVLLLTGAGYICYQKQYSDARYRLALFTLFLFVVTLLSAFG